MKRTSLLFSLLLMASAARVLLQVASMPPYAGLDEIYHVARLVFRLQEGRNPASDEPSVPIYLHWSMEAKAGALPAFGVVAERWPQKVPQLLHDRGRPIPSQHELTTYVSPNYEAQQPSLYYSLAAPLVRLLPRRTPLSELIAWRLVSAVSALLVVVGAALIAFRCCGPLGLIAAGLLVSLPTWLTLVIRASNDALACALLAWAVVVTAAGSSRATAILEGLLWAGALATKLYCWPVLIILPLLWRHQRARAARIVVVGSLCALAMIATVADLALRTKNPLGLFAFDPIAAMAGSAEAQMNYLKMAKIFVATFVWTSGQHWNALTPFAMALYGLPVLTVILWSVVQGWKNPLFRKILLVIIAVAGTFALAQAVNVAAYLRAAKAQGLTLPAGGKEGWYWYSLAPFIVLVLAFTLSTIRQRTVALFAFVIWFVAWDVRIHEGALFRDYAGKTSPARPSLFFRWGPLTQIEASTVERLEILAAGPFTDRLIELRVIHLVSMSLLTLLAVFTPIPSPRSPLPAGKSGQG